MRCLNVKNCILTSLVWYDFNIYTCTLASMLHEAH